MTYADARGYYDFCVTQVFFRTSGGGGRVWCMLLRNTF